MNSNTTEWRDKASEPRIKEQERRKIMHELVAAAIFGRDYLRKRHEETALEMQGEDFD